MGTRPIVHLANAAGGPDCNALTGTVTTDLGKVTCWRCGSRAVRAAFASALDLLRGCAPSQGATR